MSKDTGQHLPRSPIVELEGIIKEYNSKTTFFGKSVNKVIALNDISLKIHKGEIFGLVGQSGSGKTTTGRLLVKLEDPTHGTIKLAGEPINKLKGKMLRTYRSKVQMIFQDP
ncbi:MAG: ATP-binding cassette domain-containing protein, partial [Desulfobacteraceae bacterium]|nr:ATP-binding cassette domain-containing protein [Desulfobacteraceae bacterium]